MAKSSRGDTSAEWHVGIRGSPSRVTHQSTRGGKLGRKNASVLFLHIVCVAHRSAYSQCHILLPRHLGGLRPCPLPTAQAAEHTAQVLNGALTYKFRITLVMITPVLASMLVGTKWMRPSFQSWLWGLMVLGSASAGPKYVKLLGSHHRGAGLPTGTETFPIR